MTHELQPLRLAVGSHKPGSGKGCAMNLLAWMHDPTNITDYPACTARPLARLVQHLNDTICRYHRLDDTLLCPKCSQIVLDVAFAVDGTGGADHVTYIRFAVWCARESAHFKDDPMVIAAINAAEAMIAHPTRTHRDAALSAARDAYSAANRLVVDPPYGYRSALNAAAAAAATAWDPSDYEGQARYAAEYAAHAPGVSYLNFVRRAIAAWHEIAGTTPTTPEPAAVEHAAQLMTVRS